MFRKLIRNLIVLSIIVAGVALLLFYMFILTPVNEVATEEISILIENGSSVKDVADLLEDNELIKNELAFTVYARLNNLDKKIIAGRYNVKQSMNVPEILEVITTVSNQEVVVTIQEGLTVNDIDDKLSELSLIGSGDFEQAVKDFSDYENYNFLNEEIQKDLEAPLEGFLYPDTYFVNANDFESKQLIEKMLSNFDTKFDEVRSDFENQNRTMHEVITMASILQREVRTEDDLAIVSGILWKRLENGWHIGADATILYATKKKTVEIEDLDVNSPYNTRLFTGMPPGPISNPDLEHIEATLNPEDSSYWYYLTTLDTGEVIYASTNEQHNINKAQYLY